MKVCIAEKPSVARDIAFELGATQKKNGYFEGNGYQVTWTFGHLCTLYDPQDYQTHWKRWDINTLPMLPDKFRTKLVNQSSIKKQFQVIKSLFDRADVVINCGDAGQEGELIQRWVIEAAGYTGAVQRLWISSLTKEAILEGFKNLKEASNYDSLYHAGSSRAIGDWILGINATRLFTLMYGRDKQVLSIGRVQTPTLAMVVQRFLEIQNFKPQPFWELHTVYRNTLFKSEKGKFDTLQKGKELINHIDGKFLVIKKIAKKKGKEYAPKLFDLTSLQVHCNNKFGFTAEETLGLIQQLYEKKLVTYPRVDTQFLPTDLYPKIKGILNKMTAYQNLIQPLMGKSLPKSNRVFNDKKVTDHHAIIPTGYQGHMNDREQKVYHSISLRFIAAFYPVCDVAQTLVEAEIDGQIFKTSGKEIINEGWRLVYHSKKTEIKEEQIILPTFEKGEEGPHKPQLLEKMTKAPAYYTEATLLRGMETAGKFVEDESIRDLMKANGIGRPSTRANIIETLFKRTYIKRVKKQIHPTPLGIALIQLIDNKLLTSADLTGQWEKRLREIEAGTYKASGFIEQMKKMVDALVVDVRMATGKKLVLPETIKPNKNNTNCPKCKKGQIIKGKSAYGCSAYKAGCDLRLPLKFEGKNINLKTYETLLVKKKSNLLKGFIFQGSKESGYLLMDDQFNIRLEIKEAIKTNHDKSNHPPVCPRCKKGAFLKGKQAWGCSEYKNGCTFVIPFTAISSSEILSNKTVQSYFEQTKGA